MQEHLPATSAVTPGPRCVNLRTKAMYIPEFAAVAFSQPGEADDNPDVVCWCNRTGGELGPDRDPAALEPCRDSSRECYRSV